MIRFFEKIGSPVVYGIRVFTEFMHLSLQTFFWIIFGPFRDKPLKHQAVFEQMVFMGIQSILIVFFVMFFTGIVLAMQ